MCIPYASGMISGPVDASAHCPPGFTVAFGGYGGSKSRTQQAADAFEPLAGLILDWDYANSAGTLFSVTLSSSTFSLLSRQEIDQLTKGLPPMWRGPAVVISITVYGAYKLYEWLSTRQVFPGRTPSQWLDEITDPKKGWRQVQGDPNTWERDCPQGSNRTYEKVHYDEGIR